MRLVVDASVMAKWVLPEPMSAEARALLDHEVMVPDLAFAEITNLLTMRVIRAEMTGAEASRALQFVLSLNPISFPGRDLVSEALAMAGNLRHPADDLLYVALARQQGTRFVTAVKRLVAKIRSLDLPPPWATLVTLLTEFQPGASAPSLS